MLKNYPLTLPQEDILNEQLIYKDLPIYNIGAKIRIDGAICYEILNKAYDYLIGANDGYRMVLLNDLSGFVINEHYPLVLPLMDFSGVDNPEQHAEDYMSMVFKEGFDLHSGGYLFKFCLIKVSAVEFYLFSVYHHLIVDGFGTSLMFQRLVSIYNELIIGSPPPEYNFSLTSFVENDNDYKVSKNYEEDRAYWMSSFNDLPNNFIPLLSKKSVVSSRKKLTIPRAVYDKINEKSKENGVTSFHFLLGILFVLLKKHFQESDLTVGLPTLNRSSAQFKKTVGLFMGINLLRLYLDSELTFSEVLKQIRARLRQDYKHQRYPIGKLIRDVGCLKEVDRLLNVTISYEKQDYSFNFFDTKTTVIPLSHHAERVALAIYVREFDLKEDVIIDFDYNHSYLTDTMINSIINGFKILVDQVSVTPDAILKSLDILDPLTIKEIVIDFNNTFSLLDSRVTVVSLFKDIVNLYPDKAALSDGVSTLTYSEVNTCSNRLAQEINHTFLHAGKSPVAIILDRSVDLVIAVLGVLKAGACFIPIDPSYPKDRIAYILEHANCTNVITDDDSKDIIDAGDYNIISVNKELVTPLIGEDTYFPNQEDSAYIIYTSGTTGKPKGVEIGHRSLLNFLLSMQEEPGIGLNDKLYSVTTCSFDIFYLEILLPLIVGAEIHISRTNVLSDVNSLISDIQYLRPTIIQATPSFFQKLLDSGWKGSADLKILCGGDTLNGGLADLLIMHCAELWNMYGPTETTIWSTIKKVKSLKDVRSIGRPIRNTEIYILGKDEEVLPVGAVGGVFIGGQGLAKGYYKNPDLTNEKFFLHERIKAKVYDTGDLGRWTENGEIELLGRKDFQVKIRGFRIEIAEVEHVISELEFIDQVAVVACEFDNYKRLIAYFSGGNKQESDIKNHLINKLPRYMIPDVFIFLEEFPLTANGKIDRKTLLSMPLVVKEKSEFETENLTSTQSDLIHIFENVLGVRGLDHTSDFFELGGHSLNVSTLSKQINEKFGINSSLNNVYEFSSIWELSKFVDRSVNEFDRSKNEDLLEQKYFSLTNSQLNIWYECQKPNGAVCYNMNAAFLVNGYLDELELVQAINKIIKANDALNLNFCIQNGTPVQFFNQKTDFKLLKLEGINSDSVAQQFFNEEFDLEHDLLLKCGMLKLEENSFLFFSSHHLVIDGYSLDFFIQQLRDILLNETTSGALIEDRGDFREYVKSKVDQSGKEEAKYHWNTIFSGFRFNPIFSRFQENNIIEEEKRELIEFIDAEFLHQLRQVARQWNLSFNSALTFLVGVFINKLTNFSDFMLGSTYHGRNTHQFEKSLGMFVHTLPVRILIDPEKTVEEHIQQFKQMIAKSYQYFDYPISESYYKNELTFEVLVSFQKSNFALKSALDFGNFELSLISDIPYRVSRLPFIFNFQEYDTELIVSMISDHQYSEQFSAFMMKSFISFLRRFVESTEEKIHAYNIYNAFQGDNDDVEFNF